MPGPGYSDLIAGLGNPAVGAIAVTTSDSVALTTPCRALYVGGTGNVSALMVDGTTGVFTAVPVGTVLPIRATRINATGTTATLLVALT